MSPKETVYITDLERAILMVFVLRDIFKDDQIIPVLESLIKKLKQ